MAGVRIHDDRGSVIIEVAIVIPVLLALTAALVWVASLGSAYVRALDAAQTGARQVARGVPEGQVMTSLARTHGGIGVTFIRLDALVVAQAVRPVSLAGPLLGGITVDVSAEATAAIEWAGWP